MSIMFYKNIGRRWLKCDLILLSGRFTVHFGKEDAGMSEKRLNNTIFLMYLVTNNYCRVHNISAREFLKLDDKYAILNYVSECPDIFDSMTDDEMVEEVEQYVS